MAAADCRTRDYAYTRRFAKNRKGFSNTSDGSTGSHLQDHAARIFEHFRYPTEDREKEAKSLVTWPKTISQIEVWLEEQIAEARNAAADPSRHDGSSSVKLLFIDEKKCAEQLAEEFPISRLHTKLKIDDFVPAHYMVSFSRFPIPLDTSDAQEIDDAGQIWDWRYCISHPFDWDMVWVYFPPTQCSIAIVRTWFDGYDATFADLECIVDTFEGKSLANPMFCGLMALQTLASDTVANVREKGNRLYEAQKTTGFHTYDRMRETEVGSEEGPEPDLASVTKEVLAVASNLTGWENASIQLVSFASYIVLENSRFMNTRFAPDSGAGTRMSRFLDEQATKLAGDVQAAKHDILAWLSTATFQLQGVLNLISQKDAHVSIQIAKETKRDSSSMAAIAAMTMLFLPGTFTAVSLPSRARSPSQDYHAHLLSAQAFFALPFYEDQIKEHGPHFFWVYWVVTIPLTILVCTAWAIWNKVLNPRTKPGTSQ